MMEKESDIISVLERVLSDQPQEELEEIGVVIKVGDGICKVYGLTNVRFGEVVVFENGAKGIVLNLDEDYVSIVLLDATPVVIEQDIAKRTGSIFLVPVGNNLVGRVVNVRGAFKTMRGKSTLYNFF